MPIDPPYVDNIIADIRHRIASGDLEPGARLPSTAELVEQYGVSKGTVRAAIDRLKAIGELVGHQGIAVMVAQR